jgi:tellurite resistance protein TerC
MGYEKTLLFVTGYAIEKSLSVDNMFVFLLIFSSLAIPHAYQHKVLMAGILSAIVMRIGLILAGVSLLESFYWMTYIFGGLLLFTAIRMIIQRKDEGHGKKKKETAIEKNIAVRIMKRFIPITFELNSDKFLILKNNNDGHKLLYATPMLVALVVVEMTDLVFALDSIPAILAITTDSFIVITSNIFAILGLRSLYFLLAGMMEKFYYLKPGLALILFFVGSKMLISEFFKISIGMSLIVIFGILTAALLLSYIRTRQQLSKMVIDK